MRLSQKWIDKLRELPESGMGYQLVNVQLINGTVVREVRIVNCEILLYEGDLSFSENDIQDIDLAA